MGRALGPGRDSTAFWLTDIPDLDPSKSEQVEQTTGSCHAIMGSQLESTHLRNKLEDLSGVEIGLGENPYEASIQVCQGVPVSFSY